MLPLTTKDDFTLEVGDYLYIDDVLKLIDECKGVIKTLKGDKIGILNVDLGNLTAEEKEILKQGCLMNYYKSQRGTSA